MVHGFTLKHVAALFIELQLALFWGIWNSNNTKHLDYIKTKKCGLSLKFNLSISVSASIAHFHSLYTHQEYSNACSMCNLKRTNKNKKKPPRTVD